MDYIPKLYLNYFVFKTTICHESVTQTSRKKVLLLVEGGRNREETAREKMEEGSSKMPFPLPLTWQ